MIIALLCLESVLLIYGEFVQKKCEMRFVCGNIQIGRNMQTEPRQRGLSFTCRSFLRIGLRESGSARAP